jgi:NitT/TauT family transport system substrate-binding protein
MKTSRMIMAIVFGAFTALASAQTKLLVGHTPIAEVFAIYVAAEEGIFKKNGLDVQFTPTGLNSVLPAALFSGSVQIAAPSPTVFLQGIDGGLDMVAIGGCGVTSERTSKNIGLVARKEVSIEKASDLSGKKVGVPGLNASLHVLLRQWLLESNVDPAKVTFVEVGIAQTSDALKSRSVDAVVSGEPIIARIVANDIGYVAKYFVSELPNDLPYIVFASTRQWASANAASVKAFQTSLVEAVQFIKTQPAKAQEHISKYTKLPLEMVRSVPMPECLAEIRPAGMQWFATAMQKQGMLIKPSDVAASMRLK